MRILIRILQGVLPLVLLGLAVLAAVTMIRNRPVVETQPPQIAPPGVRVHLVELEDVELSVLSEGTVRPRTESQLVPEVSGRVMSISPSFAEGGFFEPGDVLVTIDPFDYEQAVVTARAQLAQTRLRLAQEEAEAEVAQREWEDLGRGNPRELTLRKPQLEDARASVAAAEAGLVRAERDLQRAQITAPYAGRVRRKAVDVGQFVTVGNSIGTIYAVDVAEIRLPLPDEELAYLNLPLSYRAGPNQQSPTVAVRSTFAGETIEWTGRVVRTESEIDPVSRMVHVVAEVRDPYRPGPNRDRPPLAVGMYVDAEIEGRRFEQVAVVPRAALRGRDQVIVVGDDNRLSFRQVNILRTTAQFLYVEDGLSTGERVVISTIDSPTEGMLVQVTGGPETRLARRDTTDATPTPPATTPTGTDARSSAAPPAPPAAANPGRPVSAPSPPPSPPQVSTARAPASPNAVTVLPFTDLSRQAADAQLGSGLAAIVSDRLGGIDALSVVPAAASASWVVGGTVQQQRRDVSVTVRLVETGEGNIVETIRVDGSTSDLLRIQDEVASAIVARLGESLRFAPAADPAPTVPVRVAETPSPTPSDPPTPSADADTTTRVAVRPFANLSQLPADEELATAIGQAVVALLSQDGSMTVIPTEDDAQWIVAGGIQRVGDIVRITARLVDAREGAVVRAVKVDGPVADVMRLQNEVASAMEASLREAVSVAL